jgi:hypothetical protein
MERVNDEFLERSLVGFIALAKYRERGKLRYETKPTFNAAAVADSCSSTS